MQLVVNSANIGILTNNALHELKQLSSTANVYRQLSVLKCRYFSRMRTAGRPHRTQGLRLDTWRATAIARHSALGMRGHLRASFM
jgi:hypothetical protein